MYAIAYDLNNELAEQHDAWRKIARVLGKHGFQRQQGSVFYGKPVYRVGEDRHYQVVYEC